MRLGQTSRIVVCFFFSSPHIVRSSASNDCSSPVDENICVCRCQTLGIQGLPADTQTLPSLASFLRSIAANSFSASSRRFTSRSRALA